MKKRKIKVARKHIIAAIEARGLLFFPKYAIKAKQYIGKNKGIGEFGWTISVIPKRAAK